MEFARPKIFFSSCLGERHCRYDGSCIEVDFLKRLKKHVDVIHECPEMGMGLPSPREALRLVLGEDEGVRLVFSKNGGDMTEKMEEFSNRVLDGIEKSGIDGAVLKGRSPSCGIKDVKVYKSYGKAPTVPKKEKGLFGKLMTSRFEELAVEDEGRLTNYNIREHFLTRIFTYAKFREISKKKTMKSLVKFHSENKYLLMAYSQKNLKILGKLVANHEKKKIGEVLEEYGTCLQQALSQPLKRKRNVNMLLHMFGYFSKDLDSDEKSHFLGVLEEYQNSKLPFMVPLSIIYSWVVRFKNEYLMDQAIFNPFPKELMDLRDSGKSV